MKKFFLIIVIIGFTGVLFAQTEETVETMNQKTLRKEERKTKKAEELKAALVLTNEILNNRAYVLETNRVGTREGIQIPVSSTLNFLSVDSTYGVVQLGSNMRLGANGVGGVTVEGTISQYTQTSNKNNDNFTIQYDVNTQLGTFEVIIFVDAYGYARAYVTQATSGVQRKFFGNIVPIEESNIYKGQRSY